MAVDMLKVNVSDRGSRRFYPQDSLSVGINQMAGVAPWNYGNYYLGNTTMQMMPFMLNKVQQYGLMQATGALGGFGQMPFMPMLPPAPCCFPPSFNMPMASPMLAAATPLPVAFNPLIQGMYPMASMNPVNWMAPSSFMSALSTGPMPYRPPGFEFPSNVGMVMTVPYGTPNPMLLSPSLGGFDSRSYFGAQPWPSNNYSSPSIQAPTSPMISYYPPATGAPSSFPMPYPAPVAAPRVPSMPVHQPVPLSSFPAAPAVHHPLPVGVDSPLVFSQGAVNRSVVGQPPPMAPAYIPSGAPLPQMTPFQSSQPSFPIYSSTTSAAPPIGQQLPSSVSHIPLNPQQDLYAAPSVAKYKGVRSSQTHGDLSDRFHRHSVRLPRLSRSSYNLAKSLPRSEHALPPITVGTLISDSGWIPRNVAQQTLPVVVSGSGKKLLPLHKTDKDAATMHSYNTRVTFLPRRHRGRRRRSSSSASEYDCAICAQQRDQRRLRKQFGATALSSFLLSPNKKKKKSRGHQSHQSSNNSVLSSHFHPIVPQPYERRTKSKSKSTSTSTSKSKSKSKTPSWPSRSSPILLRHSTIDEQSIQDNLDDLEETSELKNEAHATDDEEKVRDDEDSELKSEKSFRRGSQISIETLDE